MDRQTEPISLRTQLLSYTLLEALETLKVQIDRQIDRTYIIQGPAIIMYTSGSTGNPKGTDGQMDRTYITEAQAIIIVLATLKVQMDRQTEPISLRPKLLSCTLLEVLATLKVQIDRQTEPIPPTPEDQPIIMYTSGSTGHHKGTDGQSDRASFSEKLAIFMYCIYTSIVQINRYR